MSLWQWIFRRRKSIPRGAQVEQPPSKASVTPPRVTVPPPQNPEPISDSTLCPNCGKEHPDRIREAVTSRVVACSCGNVITITRHGRPIEATNLQRWKESSGPRSWLKTNHGGWSASEFQALLQTLSSSDFWPMKATGVADVLREVMAGLAVERAEEKVKDETLWRQREEAERQHKTQKARRAGRKYKCNSCGLVIDPVEYLESKGTTMEELLRANLPGGLPLPPGVKFSGSWTYKTCMRCGSEDVEPFTA